MFKNIDLSFFNILDLIGITSFAISGALAAISRKLDIFGVFIIAFVTALGGGMLRDIVVGNLPVWWINNSYVFFLISAGTLIGIFFKNKIQVFAKGLFLFDTIGLGIATIIGVEVGVKFNFEPIVSVVLGTMTACFGGVLRDVLCNRVPIVFRKEIYATASLLGGICFMTLKKFDFNLNIIYFATVLLVIVIRIVVVKYHLSLPSYYKKVGN